MPAVPANTSTSIVASGQARRRLRISGVVSSTSPMRRSVTTRMRGLGRQRDGLRRRRSPRAGPTSGSDGRCITRHYSILKSFSNSQACAPAVSTGFDLCYQGGSPDHSRIREPPIELVRPAAGPQHARRRGLLGRVDRQDHHPGDQAAAADVAGGGRPMSSRELAALSRVIHELKPAPAALDALKQGVAVDQRNALGHRGPHPRQGSGEIVRSAVHRACPFGLFQQ